MYILDAHWPVRFVYPNGEDNIVCCPSADNGDIAYGCILLGYEDPLQPTSSITSTCNNSVVWSVNQQLQFQSPSRISRKQEQVMSSSLSDHLVTPSPCACGVFSKYARHLDLKGPNLHRFLSYSPVKHPKMGPFSPYPARLSQSCLSQREKPWCSHLTSSARPDRMDLVSPSMPPPSILLASLLLISHLTARGQARPVTLTHTATDSDLRRSCTFKLNGNQYDLCPLVGSRRVVEIPTVDADEDNRGEGSSLSASRRLYEVALGGLGLLDDRSVMTPNSEVTACDDDTWVCMLDMTYARTETAIGVSETQTRSKLFRELRPVPIARKARGEKVAFGLDIDEDDKSSAPRVYPLRLFIGGRGVHDRPQAKIDLLCHESDEVAFLGEERGVHSFVWSTPHGCPMRLRRAGRWKVAMMDEEGDDTTEPPPDEDDGDGDLLPSNNRRSRRWIAAIIVISVLSVACGSILYSSERARHFTAEHVASAAHALTPLLSMAAVKLRPVAHLVSSVTTKSISRLGKPFRVGDSQLVQWAEEDMALDDSEDTMVNGGGAYDPYELDRWRGDGLDEYIPLTISPKYGRGRRARSYGATPDVETFAERGLASGGVGRFFHK